MSKFYATMGQCHAHSINGVTVDKDCMVEIEAEDYNSAYAFADKVFKNKWCGLYEDPDLEFYPRGIVLSLVAPNNP